MKIEILLSITAVALLFSSCSKNGTGKDEGPIVSDDPTRIGFGINTISRAFEMTLEGLEDMLKEFDIVAVKNDKDGLGVQYFNEKYEFVDGKWDWTTTPTDETPDLFQWPDETVAGNYPMTFYSVIRPPRGGIDLNYTNGAAPDIPIIIEPEAGDQEDYIAALTKIEQVPSNGRASFSFKHLTSKMLFTIKGSNNILLNLSSIRIVNVQNEVSPAATPAYNPITGWVNPITTAATNDYVSYTYLQPEFLIDGIITFRSDKEQPISPHEGCLLLMPQYGTPIWKPSDYSAAAKVELKNPIYTKDADGKYTQGAVDQWYANVSSKLKGSYIEVIYNIQNASDNSYIIGGSGQYIRVGYPLDLTEKREDQSWEEGKQYTYALSLGTPDASGGILLDPFYVITFQIFEDPGYAPTLIPFDNLKSILPGDPINPNGKIDFILDVEEWVEGTNVTIK